MGKKIHQNTSKALDKFGIDILKIFISINKCLGNEQRRDVDRIKNSEIMIFSLKHLDMKRLQV